MFQFEFLLTTFEFLLSMAYPYPDDVSLLTIVQYPEQLAIDKTTDPSISPLFLKQVVSGDALYTWHFFQFFYQDIQMLGVIDK